MSRIGRSPIAVPSGVSIKCAAGVVQVQGPKGSLSQRVPERISVEVESDQVRLVRPDDRSESRALHGLARALVQNMVRGVTEGFAKELQIEGVGYRGEVKGRVLSLALGFSHPVEVPVPEGLDVTMDGTTKIRIQGIDKQAVGQFAANIRAIRPPEPYKGKGVRYAGEHVRRKVGKAGVASQ